MATSNRARLPETGGLVRLLSGLASLLLAASCIWSTGAPPTTASQTVSRSQVPSERATTSALDVPRQAGAATSRDTVWRFAGTLLLPADPNSYNNVLLAVEPLKDGGWIVVEDQLPVRSLPHRGPSIPFKLAGGTVLRLDPSGAIVARQSDTGSFTPSHLVLFEASSVVVAEGAGTRGLDLRTLDTLWATDAECVAVLDRCYAYQPYTTSPPGTFDQRDPRNFSIVRAFPQVQVGQVTTPVILPEWNLTVVQSRSPDRWFDFFPLDAAAPITLPWIDRLREARSIAVLSADRLIVSYEGWQNGRFPASELTDVATGRVVARYEDRLPMLSTAAASFLAGPKVGEVLDPHDSSLAVNLSTLPLYVGIEKGIVVVPLGNGGAAVLRREPGRSTEHAVAFTKIGEGDCPAIDFTRVQLADGTADCPALAAAHGARQVLVSIGKLPDIDRFEVSGVTADEATRRLTIRVRVGEPRPRSALQTSPTHVIELAESLSGPWLVGLEPDPPTPRPFGFWTAFAINFS